ncbi:geranylgeranyl pyrophosphate synthase [Litorivivens lipolytica]|uniref:Geranylgeranyl pyrophosphate synthase n=1 Tax=Litorivivens lipolytica TaxID=1524264 RepID=A0A7W4W6G1_9GAMM|nr:farnesyl diphosphate synthase [Litorivivens lipolytica]MBB3048322.1 geranylgeranyl pyrophosphate synthase [Litorivivens lipolytica]
MSRPFPDYLRQCQQRIDDALPRLIGKAASEYAEHAAPHLERLFESIHYSTLNGGKRVRPVLVYAAARAVNPGFANDEALDHVAAAVECIHAYSLVHDDLPAMDDDDLRRGKPTCHIAFDEATAILAGDGLQSLAFELLASVPDLADNRRLALIRTLAAASGPRGMVGGQAIDLGAVNQSPTLETLEAMHQLKTGALLRAAVRLGAQYAGANNDQLRRLDDYGRAIGLAFQVQDDILDIEGSTEKLGKTQGADIARNKPTYPALLGLEGAKQRAQALFEEAMAAIANFDDQAQRLRELAEFIVQREH